LDFSALVGIISFLALMILTMLGVPVFVAMGVCTAAGFWVIGGQQFMFTKLTNGFFSLSEDYMFAVIPLFVVMGQLASDTGLANSCFDACLKWIGKIRGGLLMATIGANAIFGAVSAVPMAATMLSVKVALPELIKHKYDKPFSLAAIASASVLSSLIPPSTGTLIYCLITGVSVGRALVAGIIPGIVLTILFMITVWIYGKFYPVKIPEYRIESTWKERWISLGTLWPVVMLFGLIIGGVYLGIFTPTVGGAIGAMAALLYALAKRVKNKVIINSFWDMVIINCQMFPMLITGMLFGRMAALTNLTDYLVAVVTGLHMPAFVVMAVFILLMLLISFPLDLGPVMVITLPIFFPLLTGIGISPYVLNVVWLLLGVLGALTPPIGMQVYMVATLAKVNVMEVFKGVVPWFIIIFVFLWIVILWQPMTDFLPNLLYD